MKLTIPAFFLVLVIVFAAHGGGAYAQDCGIVQSTRATLTFSQDTFPTLWSMNDGDKNLYDRFIGGIINPADGDVIAVGERFFDEGENVGLTLRKINGRGRTQWDTILGNQGFEEIVRILPQDKGFLVLANKGGRKQPSSVWAGFFDEAGGLIQGVDIKPPSGGLKAFDIIPLNNGRSFLMAAQARDGAEAPYTALYRLDRKAKVVSRKAYQMGLENGLMSLSSGKSGFLFGGGYILDQNGRKNAWAVKLNDAGGIVWQRQYARGQAAEFSKVRPYGDKGVLLLGDSRPYNVKTPESRNTGGWVAALDNDAGNLVWERFFSEPDQDILARDLAVHDDNQISVLMAAPLNKDSPKEAQAFVRLVSFNARGVMLESAVYKSGKGANAYALLVGRSNERIILGTTRSPYTAQVVDPDDPKAPPQEKSAVADQGWAIAVPGASPYEDPCAGG